MNVRAVYQDDTPPCPILVENGQRKRANKMSQNGFSVWKDRIAWGCVAGLVGGGVSWAAWFTIRSFEQPTKADVLHMIESHAPYVEDRALIRQQLKSGEKVNDRLMTVIEKNTEAINGLKLEMGVLRTVLEK